MKLTHSNLVAPPVIDTGRLILRPHRQDDLAASFAMWSDPEVFRYTTKESSSRQRCWTRILTYLGHWSLLGFGYWAVEEKSTGRFIGELGFADFERDFQPSLKGIPEMGWVLSKDCHGKGYATEALQAAMTWGDKNFICEKVACIIYAENAPSLRVAEKIGFLEVSRNLTTPSNELLFEKKIKRS